MGFKRIKLSPETIDGFLSKDPKEHYAAENKIKTIIQFLADDIPQKEYLILSAPQANELVDKVNAHYDKGYVPMGSLFYSEGSGIFYQAVIYRYSRE
jgi:hypothetical protein